MFAAHRIVLSALVICKKNKQNKLYYKLIQAPFLETLYF